MNEVRTGWWLR